MLNSFGVMVYEERYKDLLRQAESKNSKHLIHIELLGSHTLYRQALVCLGRLLLNWGWRLQTRWGGIVELPPNYLQTRQPILR